MIARVVPLALVLSSALLAQEPAPRTKTADYPVHVKLASMEIGAEYLVHSIPVERGSYFAKEFLVIEVAVSPVGIDGAAVSSGQFTLRVNGKSVLYSQSPGMVAAALKYPDWETRPNLTAQAGPVIVGQPPVVGRFPGDPRPTQSRLPPAPRVPEQPDPSGEPKEGSLPVEQAIARAALPEGRVDGQLAKGCLFFPFRGKTKSIRSLELVYASGENGPKATLRFF